MPIIHQPIGDSSARVYSRRLAREAEALAARRLTPYIVMSSAAKMPSSCRGRYRRIAVIETTDGVAPGLISERPRNVVRIVRVWERCHAGGPRSAAARALASARALAASLNKLHQHRVGHRPLTLADIAGEPDLEVQRQMIEAWPGGWEGWVNDAGARTLHLDEFGQLIEVAAAVEPIRAVRVTCPTTGRQYVLRVPPDMPTARAAVAWTFGLRSEDYQPARQS
jgi:hypothetical protein